MNPAQRFDFDYLSIHKAERQETADCYKGNNAPPVHLKHHLHSD